ncbi:acetoacetate decarboxylase family protein [Massilia niabensis]|uniref:Acetoacetate decarboxylase family protein n=1 Tax=Massilia niabensis TaxID=544910 RepID=A0ABW0LDQ2_9BURK
MPQARYDMPALFGPSLMPDQTQVPHAEVIVVSYETARDAAARLLPRFFELPDTAVISVSHIDYHDIDYLGGRGYREVVISVGAVYDGPEGPLQAGFAPVMWVSEAGALTAGREYMGFAKLLGEIGPVTAEPERRRFQCAEYGNVLLEGEASRLRPLSDEALERVRRNSAQVRTFGWKVIPGPQGEAPDADYPLENLMRWSYQHAWAGEGRIDWRAPERKAAPISARVIAAMKSIPVKEYRRAFVGEGSAVIDRAATRRLGAGA